MYFNQYIYIYALQQKSSSKASSLLHLFHCYIYFIYLLIQSKVSPSIFHMKSCIYLDLVTASFPCFIAGKYTGSVNIELLNQYNFIFFWRFTSFLLLSLCLLKTNYLFIVKKT